MGSENGNSHVCAPETQWSFGVLSRLLIPQPDMSNFTLSQLTNITDQPEIRMNMSNFGKTGRKLILGAFTLTQLMSIEEGNRKILSDFVKPTNFQYTRMQEISHHNIMYPTGKGNRFYEKIHDMLSGFEAHQNSVKEGLIFSSPFHAVNTKGKFLFAGHTTAIGEDGVIRQMPSWIWDHLEHLLSSCIHPSSWANVSGSRQYILPYSVDKLSASMVRCVKPPSYVNGGTMNQTCTVNGDGPQGMLRQPFKKSSNNGSSRKKDKRNVYTPFTENAKTRVFRQSIRRTGIHNGYSRLHQNWTKDRPFRRRLMLQTMRRLSKLSFRDKINDLDLPYKLTHRLFDTKKVRHRSGSNSRKKKVSPSTIDYNVKQDEGFSSLGRDLGFTLDFLPFELASWSDICSTDDKVSSPLPPTKCEKESELLWNVECVLPGCLTGGWGDGVPISLTVKNHHCSVHLCLQAGTGILRDTVLLENVKMSSTYPSLRPSRKSSILSQIKNIKWLKTANDSVGGDSHRVCKQKHTPGFLKFIRKLAKPGLSKSSTIFAWKSRTSSRQEELDLSIKEVVPSTSCGDNNQNNTWLAFSDNEINGLDDSTLPPAREWETKVIRHRFHGSESGDNFQWKPPLHVKEIKENQTILDEELQKICLTSSPCLTCRVKHFSHQEEKRICSDDVPTTHGRKITNSRLTKRAYRVGEQNNSNYGIHRDETDAHETSIANWDRKKLASTAAKLEELSVRASPEVNRQVTCMPELCSGCWSGRKLVTQTPALSLSVVQKRSSWRRSSLQLLTLEQMINGDCCQVQGRAGKRWLTQPGDVGDVSEHHIGCSPRQKPSRGTTLPNVKNRRAVEQRELHRIASSSCSLSLRNTGTTLSTLSSLSSTESDDTGKTASKSAGSSFKSCPLWRFTSQVSPTRSGGNSSGAGSGTSQKQCVPITPTSTVIDTVSISFEQLLG